MGEMKRLQEILAFSYKFECAGKIMYLQQFLCHSYVINLCIHG